MNVRVGGEQSRRRGVFRHRDFAIYWAGGLLSNSGTWLQNVAASVLIFTLTGSPFMVGVLNFANFAPIFVFSLFGGVISDRFERRRVVMFTQGLAMLVTTGLAVVTFRGQTTPAILIGATFLIGAAYAFAKPALSALLPALVPRDELARATATNTLQFIIGQVIGSSLAALVLSATGPAPAFALNSVTFLGPIVAMLLIRPPALTTDKSSRGGGTGALLEGLRFVRGQPAIVGILTAIVFANGAVEAVRTLAPTFATRILARGESATGVIVAFHSVGAIIGVVTFGWVLRWVSRWQLCTLGFVLQGIGAVSFALSPAYPATLVASTLIGIGFSFNIPVLSARLQEAAPERLRGRVMSTFAMAHLGMRPISAICAGTLASIWGGRIAMLSFAALVPVGLWVLAAIARRGDGAAHDETLATAANPSSGV